MEIKKGISQMPEYPNAEIDYVIPENGKMYYVMKDGVLENGAVIATLDPRHAIDESNECNNMGVFSKEGTVLVDFDKKDIKKLTDNLVMAIESVPKSNEIIDALTKKNDEISRTILEDNVKNIVTKLKEEMGISGEILIEDPYTEANVYSLDSYNNKVGLDCGIIGKNNKGLYFHTNNITTEAKFIKVDEFNTEENIVEEKEPDSKIDEDANTVEPMISNSDDVEEIPNVEEINDNIDNQDNSTDLKLDIDQDILEGFKLDTANSKEDINENEENVEENIDKEDNKEDSVDNKVFENAIDTINKLMEETKKLTARIEELEEKLREKDEMIDNEGRMKNELNDILDKANEVLGTIK